VSIGKIKLTLLALWCQQLGVSEWAALMFGVHMALDVDGAAG